jgi:uncharacterized membrane protein
MKTSKALITSAVAGLVAAGLALDAAAQEKGATEKCYGVAKKGQNDCHGASHDCAGKGAKDKDPGDWKMVAKGTCAKMGGKLASEVEKKSTGKS